MNISPGIVTMVDSDIGVIEIPGPAEEEEELSKAKAVWVKFRNVSNIQYIGKDVLTFGGGCYILFYDISSNTTNIFEASEKNKGDGVQCVAGHRGTSIFAFAEKCYMPRILIYSYPDFMIVSELKDDIQIGYISLVFTEMEYLVSLSSLPEYRITLWRWRTGEKLVEADTLCKKENQLLSCSLNSPSVLSQMEYNSKRLLVWDVHVCFKKHLLTRTEVSLPESANNICHFMWSPEDNLYFVDLTGDVYVMEAETKKIALAYSWKHKDDEEIERNVHPVLTWYKGGIIESGPTLEVKYYKRSGSDWHEVWALKPLNPLRALSGFSVKDLIFAYTESGELLQLKVEAHSSAYFVPIEDFGSEIVDFCLVNPPAEFLVSLDRRGNLVVWEKSTGLQKGELHIGRNCQTMASNPLYPYVILGMSDGVIVFVNLFAFSKPYIFEEINLCEEEISCVNISKQGGLAVACTLSIGQLFLIKLDMENKMEVLAHIITGIKVADLMLFEDESYLGVGILEHTRTCCTCGDTFYMYKCKNNVLTRQSVIELDVCYTQICLNPYQEKECFAVPHRSKHLRILQTTKSLSSLKVVDAVGTGHLLRKYAIEVSAEHFVTYGVDGCLFLFSSCSRKRLAAITPHHRTDYGIQKAIVDPLAKYIISLGRDGSLVCTCLDVETYVDKQKHLKRCLLSLEQMLTTKPSLSITSVGKSKTWLESQKELKEADESLNFGPVREEIIEDFKSLQEKVVKLLEKNYVNPPEEQLPIECFDLDKDLRRRRIEESEAELIRIKTHLESVCVSQDKLCESIKKNTWDKMEVKCRHIKAFLGEFEVENYALFQTSKKHMKQLRIFLEHQKLMSQVSRNDSFAPWIPKSDSKLLLELTYVAKPADKNESERIREAMLEEEQETEDLETVEDPYAFSGSSSHKYVELSPYHLSQFEASSYFQLYGETILLQKVQDDLRHYFNNQFNEMVTQKEREMNLILERNKRLRYILSELNDTEKIICDPTWTPTERPETIIKVEEDEVPVKPYISPSQQIILDRLAAEEEARRLAELADDFRERALIEMMDGVLELLWEHKIKRDIPKPKCMLEKQPEDWNEEDLRIVKDYEEKVKFLMSERERYRKMLEAEFKTLIATVRESMLKYDSRLFELFQLKLMIQSCIDQEILKIMRARYRCQQRKKLDEQEEAILSSIEKSLQDTERLQERIRQLQEASAECHSVYDGFVTRERNLDKYFKKDFPEISAFHREQLYKLYKRRPRMHQKAQMSVSLLNELSQNSITAEKPSFLPSEYIDFLKALDNLDNYSNCPANIEEDTWKTLCRVRRVKIECELKIKASALELAEADKTVSLFQKKLSAEKENHSKLLTNLKNIREEKLYQAHNMQIQVVMQKGIVEIPTTGSMSDYDDAILINRSIVENTNKVILEAGNKKLEAMHQATNFRRGNICLEWEHRTMLMQIEDLKDHIRTIEGIKVTKEIQAYLKRTARNRDDKGWGIFTVEKEMAIVREQYEKKLRELEKNAQDLDKKIKAIKRENTELDNKIVEINVEVSEKQLSRDLDLENKETLDTQKLLETVMKRNRMVAKIQKQHNDILVLQTELELLRLKTYPTLKYTTIP